MHFMQVTVVHRGKEKKMELDRQKTVTDVIRERGLNDETLVIKLNGRIAHPSERLRDGDVLEFVEVIYGG